MTYKDGEDGDRLESSLIDFSEISCNIIRYNSGYSPHIEDIQDEPDSLTRDHAPFGTYLQTFYFNSTAHGTNPNPNDWILLNIIYIYIQIMLLNLIIELKNQSRRI